MPEENLTDTQKYMEDYFKKREKDGTLDGTLDAAMTQVGLFGLAVIFGTISDIPGLEETSTPMPLSAIIEDERLPIDLGILIANPQSPVSSTYNCPN